MIAALYAENGRLISAFETESEFVNGLAAYETDIDIPEDIGAGAK